MIKLQRQRQDHISPAHGSCRRLLDIILDQRYGIEYMSVFRLLHPDTFQPVLIKSSHVLIVEGGRPIHHHIPGPSCLFPGRAVRGDGNVVGTLAPVNIILQLIQPSVRAAKCSCHRILRADGQGRKLLLRPVVASPDPHITESVIGKLRREDFFPVSGFWRTGLHPCAS